MRVHRFALHCRKIRRPSTPSLEDYTAISLNKVGRSRRGSITEDTEDVAEMTTSEKFKLDRINARLNMTSPEQGRASSTSFTSHTTVTTTTTRSKFGQSAL